LASGVTSGLAPGRSGRSVRSVDLDAEAALDLGLGGTPYFFINGRPIDGDVPIEKFDGIIREELHGAPHDRG